LRPAFISISNTESAYQIPYYSRGIEGEKRTHPRIAAGANQKFIRHFDIVQTKINIANIRK
jgi:hypothetical protein